MYKKKPKNPPKGEYMGYPLCTHYKYLGTILSNHINIDKQVDQINYKAFGIESKVLPFRLHATFRFNSNFFKVVMNPQFRLMGILWESSSDRQRSLMMEVYKKRFKSFLCLPKSVSNKII